MSLFCRCTEDELKKLSTAAQNGEICINKENSSTVVFSDNVKTKIVCKYVICVFNHDIITICHFPD